MLAYHNLSAPSTVASVLQSTLYCGAIPERGDRLLRSYELIFIAQPELDEAGLNALTERVQQVMADNGGEVIKVEEMGRHKLAYPIQHQQEGYYVLIQAGLGRSAILETERSLRLSEDVLRYLLVRLEEVEQAEQ